MNYLDGQEIRLGDKVVFPREVPDSYGIVVFSIDTDEYSAEYPKKGWEYLEKGVMIDTTWGGLVHYSEPSDEFELVERNSKFKVIHKLD
ncbi:MAG: hypothetical protein G3M70_13210 [Candidatus Nitronauta litoralis]|uniref:Uncharacterized protein n=1 Tax=Candidatus Nitronauta litoralis TaxID=2705533 RepID=A0A7T0BYF2_9BACT|nr:MAG: hypothetical protein G3M70_13210 [Candidatus Nitronauta litoralis]